MSKVNRDAVNIKDKMWCVYCLENWYLW